MQVNLFEGARRISVVLGVFWVAGCVMFAVLDEPYTSVTYAIEGPGYPPAKASECGENDAVEHASVKAPNGKSVRVTLCFTASRAEDGRLLVPYSFAPLNETESAVQTFKGQSSSDHLPDLGVVGSLLVAADAIGEVGKARKLAEVISALKRVDEHATWLVENKSLNSSERYESQSLRYQDSVKLARSLIAKAVKDGAMPRWTIEPPVNPQGRYVLSGSRWLMNERYSPAVQQYVRSVRDGFSLNDRELATLPAVQRASTLQHWKTVGVVALSGLFVGWLLTLIVGWVARGFLGIPWRSDTRPNGR